MKTASPPLTYPPAYLGLFAALFLAMVCNNFLDIQYGLFLFETIFWALVFGITAWIGWRQQGEAGASGLQAKKMVFILGVILTVLIFIPMWRFPRAGVAMLGMLQATQNCVTVNRRGLHMGLLVSAVLMMFAATHHRADWTMLFYLVPYIVAVVYTLVAEQVSRRADDLRRESLGKGTTGGQGAAIVAATLAILLGGALLYNATPQVSWPQLFWKYGQPGNIGLLGNTPGQGQAGQQPGDGSGGGGGMAGGQGSGEAKPSKGGWPSPEEMRQAARRKGMPEWQAATIMQMADWVEMAEMTLRPLKLGLDELLKDIREWLQQHKQQIMQSLLALIALALLIAAWLLLREARAGLWLRSRFDYLQLGLLRLHAPGNGGAYQYYRALQRLMDVQGLPRPPASNTREYLAQIVRRFEHLRREMIEITFFFERARYGSQQTSAAELVRVRQHYRQIYQRVERLD